MKKRCELQSDPHFQDYGGRGIIVCKEWSTSFEAFRDWAVANGYQPELDIDRMDNDLGYCPENCHFVTCKENQRNRRSNHLVTAWGETKTIVEWSEDSRCRVAAMTLQNRLSGKLKSGQITPEIAISTPPTPNGRQRQRPPREFRGASQDTPPVHQIA
jgi:hypothetical protein